MAMENSVSFKVFLHKEESPDQPEVRRFGIDRDVVSNFSYLREKLQNVFPSLNGKNFAVQWKDADGDSIVITSDDELMIALTEMQTDVRKLYVVVKVLPEPRQQPRDGAPNAVHTGVSCDGCGKTVQGFRYKCVQCPDYDLCATCENANLHGEHFMIRVPVPISWRPYFGRRLAHHLSKSARKGGLPCDNWGSETEEGGACPFAPGPYPCGARGSHGRHRGHGGHHPGHGGPPHGHGGPPHGLRGPLHGPHPPNWLETLSQYLSDWTNLPGEAESPNASENTEANQQQQQQQQQQQEYAAEQHIKYLRTVGQTVANLLDPLGIDVDIEVRSKNGTGEKVTKTNEDNNGKTDENVPISKNVTFADNVTINDNVHETVVKEVASQINDLTIHDNEGGPGMVLEVDSSSRMERTSPESEGWTVVSGLEAQQVTTPSTTGASSVTNAGAIPKQTFNAFPAPAPAPAPATPVPVDGGFYEAAHQAAVLGAQQAMAAHEASMLGAQQVGHDAGHRAAHDRAVLQAHEAAHQAAVERAAWQAQQVMAASGNNNSIYPNLGMHAGILQFPQPPQQPQHPQQPHHPQQPQQPQPQQPQQPYHPQRHIAAAVGQMMSMGFTNEGGWLTQLLETQNGNITKALDVLQPVVKK